MAKHPTLREPFGPIYPDLGVKVAKLRKSGDRKAHGRAVLDAILSKQRAECGRVLPPVKKPNCASGTDATTGDAILKAVRKQQVARAHAASAIWYTEKEQRQRYAELMTAKRAAISPLPYCQLTFRS